MTDHLTTALLDLHRAWTRGKKSGQRLIWRDLNDLTRADLAGADLTRADLADADLAGADLAGAKLARANLCGANLYLANLYDANLDGADLTRADLADADLAGAKLVRAKLAGAKLAEDLIIAANWWRQVCGCGSEGGVLEAFIAKRHDDLPGLVLRRGCSGWLTADEFLARVQETHGDNAHGREYRSQVSALQVAAAPALEKAEGA